MTQTQWLLACAEYHIDLDDLYRRVFKLTVPLLKCLSKVESVPARAIDGYRAGG
jgi:hypothetical protein